MKSKKLVLVFALLLSFVLITSGCSVREGTSRKIEPGTMSLPEKFERYPNSSMSSRNYYFAGNLPDAPDQNADYVIFFYEVSADLQDVYDFYLELLDEDEANIEDNLAYIIVGNDRVNFQERRTTSFTSIKIYIHVDEYIAAKGE